MNAYSVVKKLQSIYGRRALITGATGYLGIAIAHALAEQGTNLILLDRNEEKFEVLLKQLDVYNVKLETCFCDIEYEDQRQNILHHIYSNYDDLSILINNAAFVGSSDLSGWAVPYSDQKLVAWRRSIEVNLTAVFHLCQGLTDLLNRSPGASIINISSIYGHLGPDWSLYNSTDMSNPAGYSVSKGGLLQLTRWLSTTLAPSIRVNAISPGGILRGQPDMFVESYKLKTPMGRMATESDILGAVIYLASDMSSYVTGQTLIVDGGWSAW